MKTSLFAMVHYVPEIADMRDTLDANDIYTPSTEILDPYMRDPNTRHTVKP